MSKLLPCFSGLGFGNLALVGGVLGEAWTAKVDAARDAVSACLRTSLRLQPLVRFNGGPARC